MSSEILEGIMRVAEANYGVEARKQLSEMSENQTFVFTINSTMVFRLIAVNEKIAKICCLQTGNSQSIESSHKVYPVETKITWTFICKEKNNDNL